MKTSQVSWAIVGIVVLAAVCIVGFSPRSSDQAPAVKDLMDVHERNSQALFNLRKESEAKLDEFRTKVVAALKIIDEFNEARAKQAALDAEKVARIEAQLANASHLSYCWSDVVFGVNRPDGTPLNNGENEFWIRLPANVKKVVAAWHEARDEISGLASFRQIVIDEEIRIRPEGKCIVAKIRVTDQPALIRFRFHILTE